MTATTKYSLEGKVLKLNSAADAAIVVEELNALDAESLEEIIFSGNTFGVEAAKAVADALKNKSSLKIANLGDIFTGRLKDEIPLALDAFVDALVDKRQLQVIDLCDNAFGPAGAAPIRRLFIENRSIRTLKLNNNGLGIEGGRLIATSLSDAAAANKNSDSAKTAVLPNMNTIIMGRNRLETVAAQHLSLLAFPVLPNLKELRMPQNGIRPEGIQVLLKALGQSCPLIEVLDLQDNTFTKPGSLALVAALPSWPNLTTLNIGDCLLGKAGSKAFLRAITPIAPKLESLIYTFNEMDLAGAQLIPGMLANKPQVHVLHLNGNMFDADNNVVDAIRAVLERNGHRNALDELGDMEEPDSDTEEEEEDEEGENGGQEHEKTEDDIDALANALGDGLKVTCVTGLKEKKI
ncbi:hypothetical protein HK100_008177 [Physocladia obscura]|uniref:RNI-like protein n=1 Tax=Physocladia obscura TaxID=109957 RepID=A0AAD5SU36_9FUNG|nr:hypothetical protein HK100_008177 [Physocladia obscura]